MIVFLILMFLGGSAFALALCRAAGQPTPSPLDSADEEGGAA